MAPQLRQHEVSSLLKSESSQWVCHGGSVSAYVLCQVVAGPLKVPILQGVAEAGGQAGTG